MRFLSIAGKINKLGVNSLMSNDTNSLNDIYKGLPGGPQDIFYSQPEVDTKPTFVKGKGIYLWDEKGKKYIDASSGPVTCNLGHANQEILEAINQQGQKLSFSFPSTGRNQPNIELSKQVATMAGEGFERVLFASGGSEAMDMAIKFARQLRHAQGETKRNRLISCQPSYHGMNLSSLAVSGDPIFSEIFSDMITMGEKIPAMMDYKDNHNNGIQRLLEDEFVYQSSKLLEEKITQMGSDNVLAFIIEPVGGSSSGALAPPENYFNQIREICNKYGVLLIYDEVMSGSGRTGEFLTSHLWPNARPDISVIAKGLGAGYMPLGAMLTSAKLVDELTSLTGFNYAYTYNASPVACAAGIAVLEQINKQNLLQNCREKSAYLKSQLESMKQNHPSLGDVRGRGLLLGIELVSSQKTRKSLPLELNSVELFKSIAVKNGLLIYGRRSNQGIYGDVVLVAPPINSSQSEVEEIINLLDISFTEFEKQLLSLKALSYFN